MCSDFEIVELPKNELKTSSANPLIVVCVELDAKVILGEVS